MNGTFLLRLILDLTLCSMLSTGLFFTHSKQETVDESL